jgi:hypothetical protein
MHLKRPQCAQITRRYSYIVRKCDGREAPTENGNTVTMCYNLVLTLHSSRHLPSNLCVIKGLRLGWAMELFRHRNNLRVAYFPVNKHRQLRVNLLKQEVENLETYKFMLNQKFKFKLILS